MRKTATRIITLVLALTMLTSMFAMSSVNSVSAAQVEPYYSSDNSFVEILAYSLEGRKNYGSSYYAANNYTDPKVSEGETTMLSGTGYFEATDGSMRVTSNGAAMDSIVASLYGSESTYAQEIYKQAMSKLTDRSTEGKTLWTMVTNNADSNIGFKADVALPSDVMGGVAYSNWNVSYPNGSDKAGESMIQLDPGESVWLYLNLNAGGTFTDTMAQDNYNTCDSAIGIITTVIDTAWTKESNDLDLTISPMYITGSGVSGGYVNLNKDFIPYSPDLGVGWPEYRDSQGGQVVTTTTTTTTTTQPVQDGTMEVTGTAVAGAQAGTFGVRYDLVSNPSGAWSFGQMIEFDNTKVEMISVEHNSDLFDEMLDTDAAAIAEANQNGKYFYTATENSTTSSVTGTGTIGTVWFKLKSDDYADAVLTIKSTAQPGYNFGVDDSGAIAMREATYPTVAVSYNSIPDVKPVVTTPVYDGKLVYTATPGLVDATEKTFSIAYDLTENTGASATGFEIHFDNTKVEFTGITTPKEVFGDDLGDWVVEKSNTRGYGYYNGFVVNYDDVASGTGAVAVFNFKLKDGISTSETLTFTANPRYDDNFLLADPYAEVFVVEYLETIIPEASFTFDSLLPNDPGSAMLTASTYTGENEYKVTYNLATNPGIAAARVAVNFDPAKVQVSSVTNGSVFATGSEWIAADDAVLKTANEVGTYLYAGVVSGVENTTATG